MNSLRSLDLNLLVALDALLEERNVTRAGQRLGLGQSAMSSALKRLRETFGDDLLVQVGRSMALTRRAEDLRPQIRTVLTQIESALANDRFDPAKSHRQFVLASADYVTFLLLPPLLRRLQEEAPYMRIEMVDLSNKVRAEVSAGDVDGIIAPRDLVAPKDVLSRSLFRERLVCIAAKQHPRIRGKLDAKMFKSERLIGYVAERGRLRSSALAAMRGQRIGGEMAFACPQFLPLPALVGATDAIALVQERLARAFEDSARLQIIPPPFPVKSLDIALFWTGVQDADPAHRWLRERLAEVARDL